MEQDTDKREVIRKDLAENILPQFLEKFNDIIAKNGGKYVVGKKTTYADFFVANFAEIWRNTIDSTLLDKYPALQKQIETVLAIPQIKDWVENKRPDGSLLFGLAM
jgi:glutathione S-transferase